MSINKVVDVWDEHGNMMNSCMDYESYREKGEKWVNLFKSLSGIYDSEITLNHRMIEAVYDAMSGLVKASEDAINDKSEIIDRLQDRVDELKEGERNGE